MGYRRSDDRLVPVGGGEARDFRVGLLRTVLRADPRGCFDHPPSPGSISRIFPWQADLGVAAPILGASAHFGTARAEIRAYAQVGARSMLAARLGGSLASSATPVTEQFRVGGDEMEGLLRGHPPALFLGRRVAFANAEYRYFLTSTIAAAAFVDVADMADGANPTRGAHIDFGAGVRILNIPLGLFVGMGDRRVRGGVALNAGF